MKIHVSNIPDEGMRQHARYDPSVLDMDRQDVHLREPFEVDAFIIKAERELIVDVDIHAPLQAICARCLDEFDVTISPEALFSYAVQLTDTVDITEDVRQEIMLAYPMVPVCRPECKGLCKTCGHNLNAADCGHQHE